MPKPRAAETESGDGWSELNGSASSIADACPTASRELLQSLLKGVALTGCVWRSELRAALKGVAHYGNWLTVAGLDRDMFAERGVEAAIPAFVLRQFTDRLDVHPKEVESELERDANVGSLQLRVISTSMGSFDIEEVVVQRRHARQSHHQRVCEGLVARFYQQLQAGGPIPVAAQSVSDFVEKCVAACKDVAAMYPEDIVPAGSPEQSAFAMARRTAENIEARIKSLTYR